LGDSASATSAPSARDRGIKGGEVGPLGPSPPAKPDAYLILAAGQWLHATTIAELAEIAECAIAASDRIELAYAQSTNGWRRLTEAELERFLLSLAVRVLVRATRDQESSARSCGPQNEEERCSTRGRSPPLSRRSISARPRRSARRRGRC